MAVSHARHDRAAAVTSLIYGNRDKKPNLKKIFNDLTGKKPDAYLKETHQDLLKESQARARIEKKIEEEKVDGKST